MNPTKTDARLARCAEVLADCHQACGHQGGAVEADRALEGFVTRSGLAGVLKVSLRTVDGMVAAREITPVRIGRLVRFYLPDVVRELTAAAVLRAGTTRLRTTDHGSRHGESQSSDLRFGSGQGTPTTKGTEGTQEV